MERLSQFLGILRGLDSSVPQDTTTANATPGNLGWMMTGWSNSDMNTTQISSQYFWNTATSYLGWPSTASTVTTTPTTPTITQSQSTATQSSSVAGTTPAPVTSTNTTNATSTDLMIGGVDVTTAMSAVDPILGVPYVAWAGIAIIGFYVDKWK